MAESQSRVEKKYSYDEMDRLVSVTYEDGRQVVYRYDAAGNRISVSQFSAGEKPVIAQKESAKMAPSPPPVYPIPQPVQQTTCPNCRALVEPGARFCPQCAAPLPSHGQPAQPTQPAIQKRFCPKCGKARQGDRRFCASCGYDFNS